MGEPVIHPSSPRKRGPITTAGAISALTVVMDSRLRGNDGLPVPPQHPRTEQIDHADGEDDAPRPLPETMVGHALDDERRQRGRRDGERDGGHERPFRHVRHARTVPK